jgi:hypothetical protein
VASGLEDVLHIAPLALVQLAEELLAQHLGEADHGVERGAQLVRHGGQELRLVPVGGLELGVEPAELVVGPVQVGGQRAELVAVRHVDAAREVPGRDLGQPGLDQLDRADDRPRHRVPE